MPIIRLTARAKEKGAVVLIDGAHAPGMVAIDVDAIGADLYTGNCHKWLFAPKGTAFLWARRSVQTEDFPLPCVISSMGKEDFVGEFLSLSMYVFIYLLIYLCIYLLISLLFIVLFLFVANHLFLHKI